MIFEGSVLRCFIIDQYNREMKKIITLNLLILVLSFTAFSQTVPNAGFESWITPGNYSNPVSWDTPNSVTTAIPFIGAAVVTKSSGGHSGSWCARLENKNFIALTVPGIMTLGTLNIDLAAQTFSLEGGAPYNQRPDLFKGFYKYAPLGGDSCAFLALFYKHNPNGGKDTIGMAFYISSVAQTTWTPFESPVTWFTNDVPDTMNIIASAAASFTPAAGSVLYVDDLSFDFYSGVNNQKINAPISIDYSRFTKDITVSLDLPGESKVTARIVNLTGQTVRSMETTVNGQKIMTISMENQPKGLYIVDVQTDGTKKVKKIILN